MVFFIPHPFPSPVYRLNTWKDWNEGMEEGINGEKKRKDMVSEWDDNDRQEGQTSSQRHLTATRRKRWLGVKDGERWVTSFVSFPPVLTHHHLRIIDKGWCGKEWRCGWVCWSLFPSYHLFSLSHPPFKRLWKRKEGEMKEEVIGSEENGDERSERVWGDVCLLVHTFWVFHLFLFSMSPPAIYLRDEVTWGRERPNR